VTERILFVEDEEPIAQLIAYNVRNAGFDVTASGDGEEALALARSHPYDLVILDVMLPGMDGFAVCRELRKERDIPILMLTARGEEIDRIRGFDLGADDYVTKPFSPTELVQRVKAILRRIKRGPDSPESESREVGPLRVNFATYEVLLHGHPVDLTPTEFQMVKLFVEHPGRVFTRDQLVNHLMGPDFFGDVRTIDVHVRHLRCKLEENPAKPVLIQTVRGAGYRLARAT
jgi:two-component system alkaline phosphatase synthesis response regulator PhoP